VKPVHAAISWLTASDYPLYSAHAPNVPTSVTVVEVVFVHIGITRAFNPPSCTTPRTVDEHAPSGCATSPQIGQSVYGTACYGGVLGALGAYWAQRKQKGQAAKEQPSEEQDD